MGDEETRKDANEKNSEKEREATWYKCNWQYIILATYWLIVKSLKSRKLQLIKWTLYFYADRTSSKFGMTSLFEEIIG